MIPPQPPWEEWFRAKGGKEEGEEKTYHPSEQLSSNPSQIPDSHQVVPNPP